MEKAENIQSMTLASPGQQAFHTMQSVTKGVVTLRTGSTYRVARPPLSLIAQS